MPNDLVTQFASASPQTQQSFRDTFTRLGVAAPDLPMPEPGQTAVTPAKPPTVEETAAAKVRAEQDIEAAGEYKLNYREQALDADTSDLVSVHTEIATGLKEMGVAPKDGQLLLDAILETLKLHDIADTEPARQLLYRQQTALMNKLSTRDAILAAAKVTYNRMPVALRELLDGSHALDSAAAYAAMAALEMNRAATEKTK